jgi:hypothetical protein
MGSIFSLGILKIRGYCERVEILKNPNNYKNSEIMGMEITILLNHNP